MAKLVEAGPDPARHGVVRWRRVDLRDELERRFGVALHERSVGKLLAKVATAGSRCAPAIPKRTVQPLGFARSTCEYLSIKALNSVMALSSVIFARRRADDTKVQQSGVIYLLRKSDHG